MESKRFTKLQKKIILQLANPVHLVNISVCTNGLKLIEMPIY